MSPFQFFFCRDAINLQLSIDHGSCPASFATLQVQSTMDGPNVFEGRLDVRVCKSQPIVIPNPATVAGDNLGGEVCRSHDATINNYTYTKSSVKLTLKDHKGNKIDLIDH